MRIRFLLALLMSTVPTLCSCQIQLLDSSLTQDSQMQASQAQAPQARATAEDGTVFTEQWAIQIASLQLADEFGDEITGLTERAYGQFVVLFLDVTNRGDSPALFLTINEVYVADEAGNRYFENTLASSFAETRLEVDRATYVQPGDMGQILAVFDLFANETVFTLNAFAPVPGQQASTEFNTSKADAVPEN